MMRHIKVINIENKGRGVIAIDDIPKHTVIMIDKPLLHLENNTIDEIILALKMNKELLAKFNTQYPFSIDKHTLSIESFQQVSKLSPTIEHRLMLEKYRRNTFNADNNNKKLIPVILINGSLFNHSCYPNVSFHFHNNCMYFFTNRDVKKGEELTDSYVDLTLSTKERKQYLYTNYGFTCCCDRCENKLNIPKKIIINIMKLRKVYCVSV